MSFSLFTQTTHLQWRDVRESMEWRPLDDKSLEFPTSSWKDLNFAQNSSEFKK